jgi:hypothetical protein
MIILTIQSINNVNLGVKVNSLDKSAILVNMIRRLPCYPLINKYVDYQ